MDETFFQPCVLHFPNASYVSQSSGKKHWPGPWEIGIWIQVSLQVFSSVQSLNSVSSVTPWIAACQVSLSITNSRSLLKRMSIESVMPSNHLILCFPLLPPSIFPSIRVFSNESVLPIRWPKYWSFKFSISPSNEYSGLISFRIDWFDLLAGQGTLKSLLQYHNLKEINSLVLSLLYCPALTSIHDYWKNYSFDYMDLCWQSNISAF